LSSFLAVLLLTLVISIVSYMRINQMEEKANNIKVDSIPSTKIVGELHGDLESVPRLVSDLVLFTDSSTRTLIENDLNNTIDSINKNIALYKQKYISNSKDQQLANKLSESWNLYSEKIQPIVAASKGNDLVKARALIGEAHPLVEEIGDIVDSLFQINEQFANKECADSVNTAHSAAIWLIILATISILVGLIIALKISSVIVNPVKELVKKAEQVANGDLSMEEMEVFTFDEIGQLEKHFNIMTKNLRGLVQQVSLLSAQVAASSQELSAGAEEATQASEQITNRIQEIAVGTETTAKHVNELSSTIVQMTAGIEQVTANTQLVADNAEQSANTAEKGNQEVINVVNKINDIKSTTENTAHAVDILENHSAEIGKIVEVITGIASQTNLLALNAAIEAARAGEQGRGFAVVAEEVRKLAEQSGQAAEEIAKLIRQIQKETTNAVESMENGKQVVEEGIQAVRKTGDSFKEILKGIEELSHEDQDISAAMEQMAAGANNIVDGVKDLDTTAKISQEATREVASAIQEQHASLEEIASSADTLASMAQSLQEAISKFRI